jgi:hypothetical protein
MRWVMYEQLTGVALNYRTASASERVQLEISYRTASASERV